MEHSIWIAGAIILGIGLFLAIGYAIKLLWNWLLPNIVTVKKITYIQALGVLLLAKLLFGGLGHYGHGWARHGYCHEKSNYSNHWNDGHCHQYK